MRVVVKARGHPNVSAKHRTTLELTKEDSLTPAGDCIIGVGADKSLKDLPRAFKELLKQGKGLKIKLECGGFKETVHARGDPALTFADPVSMVARKSGYVCGRTLCVRADKAAADLDRRLVEELKKGRLLRATLEA